MYVKVRENSRPFWKGKMRKDHAVLVVPSSFEGEDEEGKPNRAIWMIPCDVNGVTTDKAERELEIKRAQDEQQTAAEAERAEIELEIRAKILAELEAEKAAPKKEKSGKVT